MNLNELRDKAYQCAVAHGWHEENLSDEHFLCLVISELMEAVEADRKGRHADTKKFNQEMDYYIHEMKLYGENYDKAYRDTFEYYLKDSVEDELSDACIRLLDLAGLRNVDLGEVNSDELKCSEGFFDWTFTESVFSMVCNITDSNYIEPHSLGSFLRVSLIEILVFCVQKDIDIFWHIEHKMKYNELRPYKHGDKSY